MNVNITTPACDDGKRAVMVWIHGAPQTDMWLAYLLPTSDPAGGAWQGGSNIHGGTDTTKLSEKGVVSPSHSPCTSGVPSPSK